MLFHIPKQSNWVECVIVDFFCFVFFKTKSGIRKFCLGTEKQLYIYKRVCTGMFVCVYLRVRVKTFNTW